MPIKLISSVKLSPLSLPRARLSVALAIAALSAACAVTPPATTVSPVTTAAPATLPGTTASAPAVVPPPRLVDSGIAPSNNDNSEYANFAQWKTVSSFIDEMVTKNGFTRSELEAVFNKTRFVESAIQLMKPGPPGKPKNWGVYRARFVEPVRINAGVKFWNTYADALARAEAQYGVPAEIIVGILGVETVFGRNTGNFRVMDAITTLAFDYPNTPTREARMAFFRKELENTLLFARESNIDPFSLLGSYAGAIGWPQFMPSSIRQYAVDFDGDGKIDLRKSPVDAIGSVAHYLQVHGWKRGEPIVFPATVSTDTSSENRWQAFIGQGLEAKFSLDELTAAGVVPTSSLASSAAGSKLFGLVDLQNGTAPTEHWLGTDNFFAITKYNRSFFYAMSVIDLGRAIRVARGG
ncbi:lytic murein transglycosylase B [Glaciimonas sp. PCH181]|uniref:lytic murein transglycosylase B n=1 Tax=Glaciimonas sp. PCH181 TaxID=2133943 RepID=UPI000D3A95B5|nr:lytic murein transglycosylase B [Glaciimonas sp. PCH181]PUA17224.1 lytic murein transglycosylase B [Glaciimonas sp. PCH181]